MLNQNLEVPDLFLRTMGVVMPQGMGVQSTLMTPLEGSASLAKPSG
jgi:hypothetical protein